MVGIKRFELSLSVYCYIVIGHTTSIVGLKELIVNIFVMHELAQLGTRLRDIHCYEFVYYDNHLFDFKDCRLKIVIELKRLVEELPGVALLMVVV